MRKDRILLLGGNYHPEPTGIGKYNTEMMEWLAAQNYECGVVTTYPYYPFWKVQDPYSNRAAWYKKENIKPARGNDITVYRCPHYVPCIPTGIKRVLSDISFFLSAFFQVVRLVFRKKYHFVLVVAPPFQIGLLGYFYKKLKGAQLIYHIQDLQIDAALELGMISSTYIAKLMFMLEKLILRKADVVSSISAGMAQKIKSKFNRPVILFPNWADTNSFHPIANKDALKLQFNFSPADKIILYSGAIGHKQGLQVLLQAAKELQDLSFLKFIICGSGPYKDKLVAMAEALQLQNVFFMPLQPSEHFNAFLNMADVHLVMQKLNENELFLPSKLTTICAVGGLVIVTAPEQTSLHHLVAANKLGILIVPEDQPALTASIKMAIFQDHSVLKNNARKFALDFLSAEKVVADYFSVVNPTVNRSSLIPAAEEPVFQENNVTARYVPQNGEA